MKIFFNLLLILISLSPHTIQASEHPAHSPENITLDEFLTTEFQSMTEDTTFALIKHRIESAETIPHSITIHNRAYAKQTVRAIHHHAHVIGIFLNYTIDPIKIAPESFCKKIAEIAQEYKVTVPIIPLMNKKTPYHYISNCLEKNTITFSKEYAKENNPPHLRFIVGHELAHRIHETQQHDKAHDFLKKFKIFDDCNIPFSFFISSSMLLLAHLLINNVYLYYPITFYFGGNVLLTIMCMAATYKSAKICQQVEFSCDESATKLFGRTPEERIAVAQEGINYFSSRNKNRSIMNKLADFFEKYCNTFQVHPSDLERIDRLEAIIEEQQSIIDSGL